MKRLFATVLSVVFSAFIITCTLPTCFASESSGTGLDSNQESSISVADPNKSVMTMDAINSTGDAH